MRGHGAGKNNIKIYNSPWICQMGRLFELILDVDSPAHRVNEQGYLFSSVFVFVGRPERKLTSGNASHCS